MKTAGIIALLLIVMILATGCVDKAERDLNLKSNANYQDSGGNVPAGTPLPQRIATIFNSFTQQIGFHGGNSTVPASAQSSSDRQSAYEELMKQMNEDQGTQDSPSPAATQISTTNTSPSTGAVLC